MIRSKSSSTTLKICVLAMLISTTLGACPFPKKPLQNGNYKYQGPGDSNLTAAPVNYVLRFECLPSFELKGARASLCNGKTWSDRVPRCLRMQCILPPLVANGSYILTNAENGAPTVGANARYTCDVGFKLENSNDSELSCHWYSDINTAQWMGSLPSCIRKEACVDPGSSTDGRRVGNCCFEGDVVLFSCDDEFELIGNDSLQCLPEGKWSSRRPLCKPLGDHCDTPPPVPFGVVTGDKHGDYFLPYDEAVVLCQPGYKYTGESIFIMCEEETGWENDFLGCTEAFCDAPAPLEKGTIPEIASSNETSFPYNFEITYICDDGYRVIGDSWRFCTTRGWSGKNPRCEEIRCPDPGFPEHGTRVGSNFTIQSKVNFRCFAEFELLGSFERYCLPNGQWSGELARCDHPRNYCPNPGIPINGVKNNSVYELDEIIGFKCSAGYTLIGSETRVCQPDGTWSGSEVKCIGPHDFDNNNRVGEILNIAITKKEEEQKRQLEEYNRAQHQSRVMVLQARILHVSSGERLILYFAFDASGSVGPKNFRRSVELAKAIVRKIGISEYGARAGAVIFSSKAEVVFLPMEYKTTDEVVAALDSMDYTGGGTSATSALSAIRIGMMPLVDKNILPKTKKSVIFILTDGKANMGGDPQEQAELLKKAGVEIYCIGITNTDSLLQDSLYKIASEEKDQHVFILENFGVYSFLAEKIVNGTIDYSKCGLGLISLSSQTSNKFRGRIVGGSSTNEAIPWMAALYFKEKTRSEPELKCGGSIINHKYILTAAHCLYTKSHQRKTEDIIVKLGLTNVYNTSSMEEFEVEKYKSHPNYRQGQNFDNDVALIKLKRPIIFSAFIRPICLPSPEEHGSLYREGEVAVAIGWGHAGQLQENEMHLPTKSVDELKKVFVPIQNRDRCQKSISDTKYIFTERMLCAGDGNGGNDTCKGDSGGPLMQSQINKDAVYWTQIGITSWGIGCGQPNRYGFYSHVQKLLLWIKNTIEIEEAASHGKP